MQLFPRKNVLDIRNTNICYLHSIFNVDSVNIKSSFGTSSFFQWHTSRTLRRSSGQRDAINTAASKNNGPTSCRMRSQLLCSRLQCHTAVTPLRQCSENLPSKMPACLARTFPGNLSYFYAIFSLA